MKMFRELTRKQFKMSKRIFMFLTFGMAIYYIFFTSFWISAYLALAGFWVALFTWCLHKGHELSDGKYKDSETI